MRSRVLFSSVSAVLVAAACGGTVDSVGTSSIGPDNPTGSGGSTSALPEGGTGAVASSGGSKSTDPGLPDARYEDPGCKPTEKIEGTRECDTKTQTGCDFGQRCVPYVSYGEKCAAEEVGTRCDMAGTATQGDDCTFEACAAGFVCVTGGAGFVCARLCTTSGPNDDCPPGLLCSPLDVDGFSVCS